MDSRHGTTIEKRIHEHCKSSNAVCSRVPAYTLPPLLSPSSSLDILFVLKLSSPVSHTWWSGRTIILIRLLHSLQSTSEIVTEGLQGHLRGHASAYATRLIAIMPHCDGDRFCLAVLVAVSEAPARATACGESACRRCHGLCQQRRQQPSSKT
jgi:hypothetical protein